MAQEALAGNLHRRVIDILNEYSSNTKLRKWIEDPDSPSAHFPIHHLESSSPPRFPEKKPKTSKEKYSKSHKENVFYLPPMEDEEEYTKKHMDLLHQKLNRLQEDEKKKIEEYQLQRQCDLQDKLVRFERDCEHRWKADCEAQMERFRSVESANIRMQESEKARLELEKYRSTIDKSHHEYLKRLEVQELTAMATLRSREQALEDRVKMAQLECDSRIRAVEQKESELAKKIRDVDIFCEQKKQHVEKRLMEVDERQIALAGEMERERQRCERLILQAENRVRHDLQEEFDELRKMETHQKIEAAKIEMTKNQHQELISSKKSLETELEKLTQEQKSWRHQNLQLNSALLDLREQLRVSQDSLHRSQLENSKLSSLHSSEEKKNRVLETLIHQLQENQNSSPPITTHQEAPVSVKREFDEFLEQMREILITSKTKETKGDGIKSLAEEPNSTEKHQEILAAKIKNLEKLLQEEKEKNFKTQELLVKKEERIAHLTRENEALSQQNNHIRAQLALSNNLLSAVAQQNASPLEPSSPLILS